MTLETNNRGGFTLVEICVAGAITGFICLLAWPSLREHSRRVSADARAAAFEFQQQTARERAIVMGENR